MLVLSRKPGERILIGDDVVITIVASDLNPLVGSRGRLVIFIPPPTGPINLGRLDRRNGFAQLFFRAMKPVCTPDAMNDPAAIA